MGLSKSLTVIYTKFMFVKVCCISNLAELKLAVSAGVDAVGFVSAMPSGPGVIPNNLIARLASETPRGVSSVLLTSEVDPDLIIRHAAAKLVDVIQLVRPLSGDARRRLRSMLPFTSVMQVLHVEVGFNIQRLSEFTDWSDALLLDSGRVGVRVAELGGTGRVHDWTVSSEIVTRSKVPVILAGGLSADNVQDAMDTVRPFGLDVCSGLRRDGSLSEVLLRQFVALAHGDS